MKEENNLSPFEKQVAYQLSFYPLLQWKNKKTARLVRKLFKQGYSVKETVGIVVLNN